MLKTTLIAAGALVAASVVSVPAHAGSPNFSFGISGPQGSIHFSTPGYRGHAYAPWRQRALSPRAVTQRLHSQGFRRIHGLERRGHVYTARAQQRRGQRVRVAVNAFTGQVVSVRRIW